MKIVFFIGFGSFLGGISRYILSQYINSKVLTIIPYGTIGVNLVGCFLIGILFGISEKLSLPVELRLFLSTGFLGGFTTFSAFSLETINLFKNGNYNQAFIYISSSIVIGLIATYLGINFSKLLR